MDSGVPTRLGGVEAIPDEPTSAPHPKRGRDIVFVPGRIRDSGFELAKGLRAEVIEAKCDSLLMVNQAFKKIRVKEVINFIWDHIICRFGIPSEITYDNGKQFIGSKLTQFLEDHKIKRILSTPYHPCTNGQAESTNKTIIQNLKKRLEGVKGRWREIFHEVLWAYRTTPKSSTGEMPFSLVYDAEALIPVEVREPTSIVRHITESSNNEAMAIALELLDENQEASLVRIAAQKQRIERYYNKRTNLRHFGIGDFVLRKHFIFMAMFRVTQFIPVSQIKNSYFCTTLMVVAYSCFCICPILKDGPKDMLLCGLKV
uniref:Uncharacterized protein LOC104239899 n=1 Tax=Nicotiana sylvestris TaxID=4096 RepID=A0A1U7XPX9_NICSY|nr:PREDICTED: uncharacterized protein LOC104239899 [Nicotiana sylvestris]